MKKKHFVKVFAMCLSAVIVLLSFAGCENKSDAEKTQVVIWHTWNVEEGGTEHELKVIVDEYNASQDDVEVILQSQPSEGYSDKVYNAVTNNVGPDIIIEFATTLPEYVEGGFLADMGKYIDTEALSKRLPKALMDESMGSTDGKLHIVPAHNTTPVLFYNKTIYDELSLKVPETWEQLEENAEKIYKEKGIAGFAVDSYIDFAQILFMQTGATYIDTESFEVGFNNDACVDRVSWFVDNVNEKVFASDFSSGSIDGDFNAGLLGSFIGTSSYEPYITPDGFEYAAAPIPTTVDNAWAPIFNRGLIVFSSDEKTEKAACDFVEYFVNVENSSRWCRSIGALSPYTDVKDEDAYAEYLTSNEILQASVETMKNGGTTPPVLGARAIRTELKQAFLQAIGGVKTPAQALAEAEANSNKVLADNKN